MGKCKVLEDSLLYAEISSRRENVRLARKPVKLKIRL